MFIILATLSLVLFVNRVHIKEVIVNNISQYMDKTLKGYKTGKDTIYVWQDGTFQIGHYASGNHLEFYNNNVTEIVLENVSVYKIVGDKLYVIAEEGYATVDKNDIATILVTVPENEFVNGYSVNASGEKEFYSRYIEAPNISYIADFKEFSLDEREQFEKLM